jgi:putative transposase
MSNHIHLLLEPTAGTNLSKLMQWILGVFAIRFNKLFGLIGHVWYDRFKSKIISSFHQMVRTFEYISENPVKAGLCEKSSYYIYSGLYELKRGRFRLLDPPEGWISLIF